jgi:hypothetical protein
VLPSIAHDEAGTGQYQKLPSGSKYTVPGDTDPATGKLHVYTKK